MTDAALAASASRLSQLAERLGALSSKRAVLVAFGLGLLAALALPPFFLLPLLWPAFTGLVWLLDGSDRLRRCFVVGWAFGFGYFLLGLFWIGNAVLVVADEFWWFLPFAVIGLPAGLAIFIGAAATVARYFCWRGPARVFSFTASWLVLEGVRAWVLTGFPWNQPGTVWAFSDAMLQPAAIGGIWGLTLLTLLVAAGPATLADRGGAVARFGLPLAGLALLAAVWAAGSWRLAQAPALGSELVPGVRLRLVQPAVEQAVKWRSDLRTRHLGEIIALSRSPGREDITHVVWPEMAFTFALEPASIPVRALRAAIPEDGLLITGYPRWSGGQDRQRQIWNSLAAVADDGSLAGTYDKEHLVPFGEYMPLGKVIGISKLTAGRTDFSRGPGRRTLKLPGLPPVSPLICYEVIFPGAVTDGSGAAWLLNLTNDAWFGESSGPYQHFVMARLRAIEEGLPLVRVANSGISGVVDPFGRVLEILPLGVRGILDAGLPQSLEERTPFARLGNWVLAIMVAFCVASAGLIGRKS